MFDEVDKLRKHRTKNWRLSEILAWSFIGQTEQLGTSSKVTNSRLLTMSLPLPALDLRQRHWRGERSRKAAAVGWVVATSPLATDRRGSNLSAKEACCLCESGSLLFIGGGFVEGNYTWYFDIWAAAFILWPQYKKFTESPPPRFDLGFGTFPSWVVSFDLVLFINMTHIKTYLVFGVPPSRFDPALQVKTTFAQTLLDATSSFHQSK